MQKHKLSKNPELFVNHLIRQNINILQDTPETIINSQN